MSDVDGLLVALEERTITAKVAIHHDRARAMYAMRSSTAVSFDEFTHIIAVYYAYHFAKCNAPVAVISTAQAQGRVKELLDRYYKRRGGNIVAAFNGARDGTNGGLRAILDIIAEAMKAEAVEFYVREAIDRFIAQHDRDQQVDLVRKFLAAWRTRLDSAGDDPAGR